MKIVIDIDEKNYKSVMLTQNLPIGQRLPYGLSETIKNGTILPKHHGRLIDADELKKQKYYDDNRHEYAVSIAYVDWQPTIIEADKESD